MDALSRAAHDRLPAPERPFRGWRPHPSLWHELGRLSGVRVHGCRQRHGVVLDQGGKVGKDSAAGSPLKRADGYLFLMAARRIWRDIGGRLLALGIAHRLEHCRGHEPPAPPTGAVSTVVTAPIQAETNFRHSCPKARMRPLSPRSTRVARHFSPPPPAQARPSSGRPLPSRFARMDFFIQRLHTLSGGLLGWRAVSFPPIVEGARPVPLPDASIPYARSVGYTWRAITGSMEDGRL